MRLRTRLNIESLESRALLSGLSVALTTNASSYEVGQPVQLTFTETNNTSHAVTINEGPSTDGFDVKQGGATVWRSNAGINPLFIEADTLQPGQSLTLTGTWNGVPNVGTSTGGSVTGTFVVLNQLSPTTTATFTITGTSSSPPSTSTPSSTSPPTSTSTPSSTSPSAPTSPAPSSTTSVSAPNPTPVVGTSTTGSSTSKHRHAVHDDAHHGATRMTHIAQALSKEHESRPGTK
jgi:hypothetical protein